MTAAARTVISGWAAVSPFGPGSADFAAGLRDGRSHSGDASRPVAGFDVREVLGRKGTRAMDRQSAFAVAAAAELLAGRGGRIGGVGPDSALVLGTVTASAQTMMDFARDSLTGTRPYHVDPAQFPNTVLNCAAARCAIWHQLRGPNATVSAGRASGLLALSYARRLLRSGRAEVVLCGAVEELSQARSWIESGAGPLGEGCAMLLLEPAGRPGRHARAELAEVLALEFGFCGGPGEIRPALGGCIRRALAAAGETADQVWAVASSGGPDPVGASEAAALTDVVGDGAPVRLCGTELVGDTNGASAAFALVAVIASAARAQPAGHGRTALVTSVDRDGVVGCALLRLGGPES